MALQNKIKKDSISGQRDQQKTAEMYAKHLEIIKVIIKIELEYLRHILRNKSNLQGKVYRNKRGLEKGRILWLKVVLKKNDQLFK